MRKSGPTAGKRADPQLVNKSGPAAGKKSKTTAGEVSESSQRVSSWYRKLTMKTTRSSSAQQKRSEESTVSSSTKVSTEHSGDSTDTAHGQGCELDMPVHVQRQAPTVWTVRAGSLVAVCRQAFRYSTAGFAEQVQFLAEVVDPPVVVPGRPETIRNKCTCNALQR